MIWPPFCDSDFIFAICRSLETGTKDRIINAVVSQQSTSANLTFYKFMPFCRNYHISLTAFITALFSLLSYHHAADLSGMQVLIMISFLKLDQCRFFYQFCLYSVFTLLQKYFPVFFNQCQYRFNCMYVPEDLTLMKPKAIP